MKVRLFNLHFVRDRNRLRSRAWFKFQHTSFVGHYERTEGVECSNHEGFFGSMRRLRATAALTKAMLLPCESALSK